MRHYLNYMLCCQVFQLIHVVSVSTSLLTLNVLTTSLLTLIIDVLLFRGTEKQHVADDYAERLHIGQVECQEVMATVLNDLFVKTNAPKMDLSFCEYLNISVKYYLVTI